MIAPRLLALLGLLCSIAPASIDLYLPAFAAIAADLAVPPAAVQRTLGIYLLAYACMLPLYGVLADGLGRRRVIIVALSVYLLASLLCAVAPGFSCLLLGRMLQGAAAGACGVVAPAMIEDRRTPGDERAARRAMATLVLMLNLSPALAPVAGGYLSVALGWRANFAALAGLGASALYLSVHHLPETLPPAARQPMAPAQVLTGYLGLVRRRLIVALCLAGALPVAGQGLIIGGAPDLLLQVLRWQPTDFAWLFLPLVGGAMIGALLAARLPGRAALRLAYVCMAGGALLLARPTTTTPLSVILPQALYICGLAMAAPAMSLQLLAHAAPHRAAAVSLLGVAQLLMFAMASGWGAPLLAGRPAALGLALLGCALISALAWRQCQPGGQHAP